MYLGIITTVLPSRSLRVFSRHPNNLIEMGQEPTEEELIEMVAEADEDESGYIEFDEFVKLIANQKVVKTHREDDKDTLDAFVAMGGQRDKSGQISEKRLREVITNFGLTTDVDVLISDMDTDFSGILDYEQFKAMMLGDS
eukprot:TRINITY_DN2732_c0_g1_i2.p1 TRINITY_DN2732_c0_g1~~TRINITY_DN2732_c0_g1_i2.p1  ORF type:complete len:141 (+),score=22.87 TRINITY_DN2732_c0_g1_i2:80-502(+)